MALQTLGTTTTTILRALPAWSASLSQADIASIGQTISGDRQFASIISGYGPGATAVLATGSTHSNTTLDTLVGISGAPLTQIAVGDLVIGAGIPPATYVQALVSSTSVTLSAAATASASIRVVFRRRMGQPLVSLADGELHVPGRGVLKILPGDIIAIDNLGWPILVSAASINYAGSQFVLT